MYLRSAQPPGDRLCCGRCSTGTRGRTMSHVAARETWRVAMAQKILGSLKNFQPILRARGELRSQRVVWDAKPRAMLGELPVDVSLRHSCHFAGRCISAKAASCGIFSTRMLKHPNDVFLEPWGAKTRNRRGRWSADGKPLAGIFPARGKKFPTNFGRYRILAQTMHRGLKVNSVSGVPNSF